MARSAMVAALQQSRRLTAIGFDTRRLHHQSAHPATVRRSRHLANATNR
jgi:hypothetical protein